MTTGFSPKRTFCATLAFVTSLPPVTINVVPGRVGIKTRPFLPSPNQCHFIKRPSIVLQYNLCKGFEYLIRLLPRYLELVRSDGATTPSSGFSVAHFRPLWHPIPSLLASSGKIPTTVAVIKIGATAHGFDFSSAHKLGYFLIGRLSVLCQSIFERHSVNAPVSSSISVSILRKVRPRLAVSH